jgi:hypothetical protein
MTEFDNIPVEITGIEKVKGIILANSMCHELENIVNDDEDDIEEYDGSEPIEMAENLPDDRCLTFKCPCHEELRVSSSMWPYLKCPNCGLQIFRRELVDVGGICVYQKFEPKKKK